MVASTFIFFREVSSMSAGKFTLIFAVLGLVLGIILGLVLDVNIIINIIIGTLAGAAVGYLFYSFVISPKQ